MEVHDECIDDSFYASGWSEVTTCTSCTDIKCKCRGSGTCKFSLFNYYMYRAEDISSACELDQFDFPLSINVGTVDELGVEEIRCRPYIVGSAYRYYISNVIKNRVTETMVSAIIGDYKSTCFNMSCYIFEMDNNKIQSDSVILGPVDKTHSKVLATDTRVVAPLLEAICMLDISPIVSPMGSWDMKVASDDNNAYRVKACTSGFRLCHNSPINLVEAPERSMSYRVVSAGSHGVRAVSTAQVTVSLILTPKSLYGGKNPSTKLVSYFVHNVCL